MRPALRLVAGVSSVALALALGGAAVRVLPWTFDPSVPWGVVLPFARALAVVAGEAALLLGWPLGWALAMARFVDRGEGRVFALLGEAPSRTMRKLVPQGLLLAALLASISFLGGRDARAPGRVVDDLLVGGKTACMSASEPVALTVPFLDAAWLCRPGRAPRLVAESPVGSMLVSASDAHIADDFRRVELDDARFGIVKGVAQIHVGKLALSGLPPWARASVLPPWARAGLMALAGLLSAILAGYTILRAKIGTKLAAIGYGVAGPLSALLVLRLLERSDSATASWFVVVPLAPPIALFALEVGRRAARRVALAAMATRLPSRGPTAS